MAVSKREQKYIFGRLNVLGPALEQKDEILFNGLSKSAIYTKKVNNYGFYNVGRITHVKVDYICGYLVKYRPSVDIQTANPRDRDITDENINNLVIAKARFFLHVKSGIIAYHPIANDIPEHLFREVFSRIIRDYYQDFFIEIDFSTIQEEQTIFEALKEFEIVERVIIRLHPSNPSNRDIWQKHDTRFKKLNAK